MNVNDTNCTKSVFSNCILDIGAQHNFLTILPEKIPLSWSYLLRAIDLQFCHGNYRALS